MNATPVLPPRSPLAAVHLDMAIAHRDASLKTGYAFPSVAKTCRKLMREHALKARRNTQDQPRAPRVG